MKKLFFVIIAVAMVSVVAKAQVTKGKTRLISTKQIMGGVIGPNCGPLGEGLKSAPTDDKGWAELATKAAVLNEISYNLMEDGRCPDGDWSGAVETLQKGSAAVLAKLEAKDAAGAQNEFKTMMQSCGACHKAHKK